MPYAELRTELLAARSRRQERLQQYFPEDSSSLLQLTLNIPGDEKCPNGTMDLYRWAERQVESRLPQLNQILAGCDILGPWGLFSIPLSPAATKQVTVAIEDRHDFARLLDIDVFDSSGTSYDRIRLGLIERSCLICPAPAKECIRLQRHSFQQLRERFEKLLQPFAS